MVITLETRLMVDRGELPQPKTPADVAQVLLDIFDSNNNGKLTIDEAAELERVIADEEFWNTLVETSSALDTDGDMELDLQEIGVVYEVLEENYGPLSLEELFLYGRMKSVLGRIPGTWN
ncbi:uncharacterized protein LOC135469196 [Liolophura sinensis]|uniref:uncharacterized protein LOC135469196 n=1 Tax=Liolophura sinensis TaxID=3198878 RepID=UPI003158B4D9